MSTQDAVEETTKAIVSTEDAVKETAKAILSTEDAIKKTQAIIEKTQAELVQQGQTLTSFTIVTTAFLPLGFCTSVFYLLLVIEHFLTSHPISILACRQ